MPSSTQQLSRTLDVAGLVVDVERKRVKHINLRVCPPDGRVRVSAPLHTPERHIREAVMERMAWIERHRRRIARVPPAANLECVTGKVVQVLGEPRVLLFSGPGSMPAEPLASTDDEVLEVPVGPRAGASARRRALEERLRSEAKAEFSAEVAHWAPRLGVRAPAVNVRRMTSRWGTCHVHAGKVYLNLALITRPRECLTYVVVHELAHLLVPNHSRRFWAEVERHLPDWRAAAKRLENAPLWADPIWGRQG